MLQRIDESKEIKTLDKINIPKEDAIKKATMILKKHKVLMDYLKDK